MIRPVAALCGPDFFGQMRGHRGHQLCKGHDRLALCGTSGLGFVQCRGKGIELGNGCVKAEGFDAHGHIMNGFVHGAQQIVVAFAIGILRHLGDPVEIFQTRPRCL